MQLDLTNEQKVRNKRIGRIVEDSLYYGFLGIVAVCLVSFLWTGKTTGKPNVLGYRHFYIASASMEPTIRTGQFIITKTVEPKDIKVGDIVAYKNNNLNKIIVHRVTDIRVGEDGKLLFTFQGDNNPSPDPYDVTEDMIMYQVIWY